MKRLKVTNMKTGKSWEQDNQPHAWSELAIEIVTYLKNSGLVYCDIECIAKGRTWKTKDEESMVIGEQWYILDECGNYEFIPDHYLVEVVEDEVNKK